MKKFMKKTEGFTLVELIVVIAILGILAGVGTVGYSGYVKKANVAADEQLLSTLNSAFAAACLENGDDINSVTGIDPVSLKGSYGAKTVKAVDSAYDDAFWKYYAGNENAVFKNFTTIVFDENANRYTGDPASAGYGTYSYGGGQIYLSATDAANYGGTTYYNNPNLGTEKTLQKMDAVLDTVRGLDNSIMANLVASDDFRTFVADTMGVTAANFDAEMGKLVNQMVGENATAAQKGAAQNEIIYNAAAMYAAYEVQSLSEKDIQELFNGEKTAKEQISANLNGANKDYGKALAQAAVAYGMYTSYAYDSGDSTKITATDAPLDVLSSSDLNSTAFKAYLAGTTGSADLAGYLSALNMINSSTGDKNAVSTVLMNGYSDPNLVTIVNNAVNAAN